MPETVVIIGASEKPNRYSYKAMLALQDSGHHVKLVNPFKASIEGRPCFASVADIDEQIDTITLYVNPARFNDHIDEVIRAKPRRVIMNPGAEDKQSEQRMRQQGIEVVRGCTLVMLATDKF